MSDVEVPTYDTMMNPLLEAIRQLGGSGTIEELDAKVSEIMQLSDAQLSVLHNPARGTRTEFEYRLAWTRTYLKKYGLIDNSTRGVWTFTEEGRDVEWVDQREVVKFVRAQERVEPEGNSADEPDAIETLTAELSWQEELMDVLLTMPPDAFERLFQLMLREAGFTRVEVTGRSGDQGIDGIGVLRLGGFLSFQVLFQCKRWTGSVGAPVIRDFRGAMVGRADKGLLVTTGSFTNDARKEATRDGAPAIDLIDGDQLVIKLKELGMGVKVEPIVTERVSVNRSYFERI